VALATLAIGEQPFERRSLLVLVVDVHATPVAVVEEVLELVDECEEAVVEEVEVLVLL
jgi:hypothetical protein